MKKLLFIFLFLFLISGVFFYTNTYECKMQNFRDKYGGKIAKLKPIYTNATKYCTSQNFANRGPYTTCMEEQIKNFSVESYEFFMTTQNFCENLTNNLADKWMCVDEVINQ